MFTDETKTIGIEKHGGTVRRGWTGLEILGSSQNIMHRLVVMIEPPSANVG